MNMTRLQLTELLRLMRQLFAARSADRHVEEEPLHAADERLTAGLCLIAESLGSSEQAVLEVLKKARIEVRRADSVSDVPRVVADRMPDFVITGMGADTSRIARALSDAGFKGPLQPVGEGLPKGIPPPPPGVRVLPAIPASAIDTQLFAVLQEDGMARDQNGIVSVDLGLALRKGWLQFWYLPKIDLRRGRLQGAELVPRIHHPRHGLLDQDSFEVAGKNDLRVLGFSAIRSAVKDWAAFIRVGFNMEFSVNFPVEAFDGREVAAVVDGLRPASQRWKGLRIELDASTMLPDHQSQVEAFKRALRADKATLALDHVISARQLADRDGLFSEVKLDGSLLTGCVDDREKQRELIAVLSEARRTNSCLVATGVSRRSDLDYIMANHEVIPFGQGPVFSPELSRSPFIRLLQARAHHVTTRHLQQPTSAASARRME